MSSFIPILLLAMLVLATGAAATYYYLKAQSLEVELENELKKCSKSIEMMHGYYIELAERTAQKDVISKDEADKMMQGIKEIVDSTNIIKAEKGR
ncbi:MAG: hypothetical protein OQL19_05925 [Gammaproteobacteria bacterium]|nr:hypothetical protein [Gammaproteobacteria bacterium]